MDEIGSYSKILVFVKCKDLKDVEIFSKSDPFIEVYEKTPRNDWKFVGQTEVIWDNLSPEFTKSFELNYIFARDKTLKFDVFDAKIKNHEEVKGKSLGSACFTLSEIIRGKGEWVQKNLEDVASEGVEGFILTRGEELNTQNLQKVRIQFEGMNLKSNALCPCSILRPFFTISRQILVDDSQHIYSSEVSRGSDPTWDEFPVGLQKLCGSDLSLQLKFELFNHSSSGNHKLLGHFFFNLKTVIEDRVNEYFIVKVRSKTNSIIKILSCRIEKKYSFLDYIYGGCSIDLLIGVDFTSSNKNQQDPNSLHYITDSCHNSYQSALYSVGKLLLNYDSDKMIPMFGFGGAVGNKVEHCFPVNFNPEDPSVDGLEGIMRAYHNAISQVHLASPTYLSPLIRRAVTYAQSTKLSQNSQKYFILLILTDGIVNDLKEAIEWIVEGSKFPLSIVIVGIGDDDFSGMEILDADQTPLTNSSGEKMSRDIVQFVNFNKFKDDLDALNIEVLEEIPREVVGFFEQKGIVPIKGKVAGIKNEVNELNILLRE